MNSKIPKSKLKEALVLLEKNDEEIIANLGYALFYETAPKDRGFALHYPAILESGAYLLARLIYEMQNVFCDVKLKKPKRWIVENLSGDKKDLLQGVILAIAHKYSVSLSVAIPAAVIIAKHGLNKFCKKKPDWVPKMTVNEILEKEKAGENYERI